MLARTKKCDPDLFFIATPPSRPFWVNLILESSMDTTKHTHAHTHTHTHTHTMPLWAPVGPQGPARYLAAAGSCRELPGNAVGPEINLCDFHWS